MLQPLFQQPGPPRQSKRRPPLRTGVVRGRMRLSAGISRVLTVGATAVCLATPSVAHAQLPTSSWFVGGSGQWVVTPDDIDDWLHVPPPIPTQDFFLYPDNGGSTRLFSVFSSLSGAGNELTLGGPLTLPISVSSLTVYPTDTVEIADTALVVELPGIVSNDGVLRLRQGQVITSPFLPGLLTLSGGGEIVLDGSGAVVGSLLGAVTLDGPRLRGRGLVTGTQLTLDGLVEADVAGRTLEVTFGAGGSNGGVLRGTGGGKLELKPALGAALEFENQGLLEGVAGGGFEVSDTEFVNRGTVVAGGGGFGNFKDSSLANGGHLLRADAGGVLQFRGGTHVEGGTLATLGNGLIQFSEAENNLRGPVVLAGNFAVTGGTLDFEPGGEIDASAALVRVDTTLNLGGVTVRGGQFGGPGVIFHRNPSVLDGTTSPVTLQGATLHVPGNTALTLRGTLVNHGDLRLRDDVLGLGTINALLQVDGPVTMAGTGTLTFEPVDHSNNANEIAAINGGTLSTGPGITLRTAPGGGGFITVPLVNAGTVIAQGDGGASQGLYLRAPITNTGRIESAAGGLVSVESGLTINNLGGTLRAGFGSPFQFGGNVTVVGGTLDGDGLFLTGGTATLDGTTSPVTLQGATLHVPGNTALTLRGTLVNHGDLRLRDDVLGLGTINALLQVDGPVTMVGTGTLTFEPVDHSNNANEIAAINGGTLSTGPGITLRTAPGGGGFITAPLANAGTVLAQGDGGASQGLYLRAPITNTGRIESAAGGLVSVESGLTINNLGGTLRAGAGSPFQFGGNVTVVGGTLDGDGLFRAGGAATLDGTISPVTLQGATFEVGGNNRVTLQGVLRIDSTLRLSDFVSGFGTTDAFLTANGPVTLEGGGTLQLGSVGGYDMNALDAVNGGSFVIGPDLTVTAASTSPGIRGAGRIVAPLTNHGIMQANGGSLTFNTAPVNRGTIRSSGGGTVNIQPPAWYTSLEMDNIDGTITADAGSDVNLAGFRTSVTVHGGTYSGNGTAVLNTWVLLNGAASPVTLRDLTLQIQGSTDAYLAGSVQMNGARLLIKDEISGFGTWDAALRASGAVQITGTGTIEFGPDGLYRENVLRADPGHSWNLGPGIAVTSPPGAIGEIRGGATLAGTLRCDGNLTVSGGPTMILAGGTLAGAGAIYLGGGGSLVNHGTTSPGNSTGRLTIHGAFTQQPTGKLRVEISPAAHDVLQVNGTATLGGILEVRLEPGFLPSSAQSYQIVSAAALSATFANVTGGRVATGGGGSFAVIVSGGTLTLGDYQSGGGAMQTFEEWRTQNGYFSAAELADPLVSGPAADPDRDGIDNQIEFACGGHPRHDSSVTRPRIELGQGTVVFIWQRSGTAVGTLAPLQADTPAGPWDRPSPMPEMVVADPQFQIWQLVLPLDSPRRFMRLGWLGD